MDRQDIIDGLAMMIATVGADDAHAGKGPQDDRYWYMVGYYIARDTMEPQAAMDRVKAEQDGT